MTPFRATARLQLHAGFGFDAARTQVDYYADLGISHLYLSPIACAVPGSTHGYDNIDPTRINPELGGEAGFVALAAAVRERGMGLLLDIVPNHMAADVANPWWCDVLRHGRRSPHAGWFDIEWDAPGCDNQLWLPVLDRPFDEALGQGLLSVEVDAGEPVMVHHQLRLPLSPLSYPLHETARADWARRTNRSPERLRMLLARQAWRPAWWRTAGDQVNYRRFFDINGLVALRAERPEVFDAVHALPLRLVREGWVDGLRIDHIDGLADPAGYLRRLRAALDDAGASRGVAAGSLGLYVEKILAEGEPLPADWRCDGTTGYDFMDQAAALLHAPDGEAPLQAMWLRLAGGDGSFGQVQRQARGELLGGALRSDRARCLRAATDAGAGASADSDVTSPMVERALDAVLIHFPVYRTYGVDGAGSEAPLLRATAAAAAHLDDAGAAALARLQVPLRHRSHDAAAPAARRFRTRLEQLAAPLNAKAVEDTAFYRYGRLLSRNEVGSDPAVFHVDAREFVERVRQRVERHPRAMLAVATHDHKRGPDARLRLAALAQRPGQAVRMLRAVLRAAHAAGKPCPLPPGHAWMVLQTVLASWPLAGDADAQAHATRVQQWLVKALREGKQLSRWDAPAEALEAAATDWVRWLLVEQAAQAARQPLQSTMAWLGPLGAQLGLAQVLLQFGCPGVPDLYQGNEGWDLSLVDPDNRRPVDYPQLRAWRDDPRPWSTLLRDWQDGAPKARLLAALLEARRQAPVLWRDAPMQLHPVPGRGDWLVWSRQSGDQAVLLLVALRPAAVGADAAGLRGLGVAGDGERALVPWGTLPRAHWNSLLDARMLHAGEGEPSLERLHGGSPVAIWMTTSGGQDG